MRDKSIFNPHDIADLATYLQFAILRRWSMPSIGMKWGDEYVIDRDNAAFTVSAFHAEYEVIIRRTR